MTLFDEEPNDYSSGTFPTLREFQVTAHEALRQGDRDGHRCQLVMAPTGAGKCLGFGTPVIMVDGSIKTVESVVVGDVLMGPDGKGRNVLSTTKGQDNLYKITPKKGDPYIVNSVHLLSLKMVCGSDGINMSSGKHINKDYENPIFVEAQDLFNSNQTAKHCLKGWRPSAVDFENEDDYHMIPPYILGLWLGDGTSLQPTITKPDGPVVDAWKQYAKKIDCDVSMIPNGSSGCPSWRITNRGRDNDGNGPGKGEFHSMLLILDLLGNKHIPKDYIMTTKEARLELLAGLLDTDGHMSNSGFDFVQKNKQIAESVAFICRSLGLAVNIKQCKKGIASSGFSGLYWRLNISGDCSIIPCRDPKKQAGPRIQIKNHLVTGISIKPAGFGDYYGFEIDGDRQFLLGDWQVTHNTVLALNIIQQALIKGKRCMFVCDRTALINQTSDVADMLGLSRHGIIQAGHWRTNLKLPFQIASIQTLMRRQWPEMDVIVCDEAHTLYKTAINHFQNTTARVIGLSATPFSPGLGQVYTNLINSTTMHALTDSGILVPMRIFSCHKMDMTGAETSGGEWTEKAAGERALQIKGDVVSDWAKYALDRKTIGFFPDIATAEQYTAAFNLAGYRAETFTSHTDDNERAELLAEYRKPHSSIRLLLSCECLAKGFDVPDIEAGIDARPFRKSLSSVIQMWGRILRSHPGKEDAYLLDFSGNIVRFLDDFTEIFYNGLDALDMGEKLDKTIRREEGKEPSACPKCGVSPCGKRCMACGYERPSKQSTVEVTAGVMTEIVLGGKKLADDARHLYEQLCSYHRYNGGSPDKAPGRVWFQYQEITGQKPPSTWKFESTPDVRVTKNVIGKIKSLKIAWRAVARKQSARSASASATA